MSAGKPQNSPPKLYEVVHDVLRDHVVWNRLPEGLVLLEGPIADIFEVSRAPVQRALKALAEEGLIDRFDGRGYVVPAKRGDTTPLRIGLREAGLVLPREAGLAMQARASWERIYEEVETAAAGAVAFGRYRFLEMDMAAHFSVSRTVIRDVLARLQERGLVEKDARSHWVAGPLTATAMREFYEMRRLLEPAALLQAAETLDRDELARMRDRLIEAERRHPDIAEETVHALEQDLHQRCVLRIENRQLIQVIRHSQLPLVTNHMFHRYLGVPAHSPELLEHRLVFEHLLNGAAAAAAAALEAHLTHALQRSLGRLKVLSVFPEPAVPRYMTRVEW